MEQATASTVGANGLPMDVVGQISLSVSLCGTKVEQTFLVVEELTVEALLGADFLHKHKAVIDFAHHQLTLGMQTTPIDVGDSQRQAQCQVFTVAIGADVDIPGRSVVIVSGHLDGACVAPSGLIEPQWRSGTPKHLLFARSISPVQEGYIKLQVTNSSPTPVKLFRGTRIGHFIPLEHVNVVDTVQEQPEHATPPPNSIDLSESSLSATQKEELLSLLGCFGHVFAQEGQPRGRTTVVKHHIETSGTPIRQPTRRLPASLKGEVDKEVQDMLQTGVIRPSTSPWSSPVVLVKKKDGSWRFCIDFRKVNEVTHRDAYPLPRIDETLDSLAHAVMFTTLDLASGYWQVELDESSKEKTAFSTPGGHYEFNVMPFGLTNAPATFQRLMECVLAGLSPAQCLIYLDDIIVYGTSFEDHLKHLEMVLTKLGEAGLKLKPSKCHFAQQQVQYLGHLISKDGVAVDPSKVEAVTSYPQPTDVKELRGFLGLANYYRRFVQGFASIAQPLYKLTRKNARGFNWTSQCQQAFDQLKKLLVNPPILAYPQFDLPFVVHTDASDHAIGGVLSQVQDGKERVIAYWSRQLNKAQRNYSTIEREALAVVGAIQEFYPYLYGFHFDLYTDHNPLVFLKTVKDYGGRISRWLLLLQQFQFTIRYKPGGSNGNADGLSRRPPPAESDMLLTETDDEVAATEDKDPEIIALVQDPGLGSFNLPQVQSNDRVLLEVKIALQQGTALPRQFQGMREKLVIKGEILYHRQTDSSPLQAVIPHSLQQTVLEQIHDKGGHLGIHKTLEKLRERFYWPGYQADVEKWIRECKPCQRRNSPPQKPQAPLGTITAEYPFQKLSWDIMGPLPTSSKGHRYILVVTDLFTKWVEAFPLRSTESTVLATVLVNEIVCRYGVPTVIHSDQGANLTSSVIHHLCLLLGMERTRTTAYHPQGNGQVERFNRTLEAMLAKVVQANQRDWDAHLPKVLFAYRTAIHESTHFTPYHLTFGRSPVLPVDVMLGRHPSVLVEEGEVVKLPQFVEETHRYFNEAYATARGNLKQAHQQNKLAVDKKEHGETFRVGDQVWLYTPAVKEGRSKKLATQWRGPYTVVDKTSSVNYRIQLIGTAHQTVVHRNRLKPAFGVPKETSRVSKCPRSPATQASSPPTCGRPTYADIVKGSPNTGVSCAGSTSACEETAVPLTPPTDHLHTHQESSLPDRPRRNRQPPERYGDPISY